MKSIQTLIYMSVLLLAQLFFCIQPVHAASDIKDSKDHPMFSRYEGSRIIGYQHREYDEFRAIIGPAQGNSYNVTWPSVENLEGKVTRILYRAPEGRSSLEVMRNYRAEISEFEMLFDCSKDECGGAFYTMVQPAWSDSGYLREVFVTSPNNQRYLAVVL